MLTKWVSIAFACTLVAPALADDVKKLNAVDLSAQTHKWDGKKIEVQLRCFFADADEYRCAGASARVDLTKITNPDGKSYLEDKCDTMSKLIGNACLVTVRFTYSGFSAEENGSGGKMTLVEAEDNAGEVIPPSARKKR